MIRTMLRTKSRAICALLAIGLLIPAMPVAAIAAGHTTISQGIAGYVTTGVPGTPVADAAVTVWTTAAVPSEVATTTSDAEGFYEVELPFGDYYVQFEAEGYLSQFYDGVTDLSEATTVTVAAGTMEYVELWGPDRYDTAIAISQRSHPSPAGADVVVIARGDRFPDALAGASLAGVHDAPILLTRPNTIPAAVVAEINRLNPSQIYILGNTLAVSAAVETQLATLVGGAQNVDRFGGQTRYHTAVAIAEHVISELGETYDGTAFVATGARFPDALAASPIMAAQGIPLFLSHPTSGLSAHTKTAIDGAVTDAAFIVGGPLVVGADVEEELEDMLGAANVVRVDGDNRYDTAVAVAEFGVDEYAHVWEGVGIATGERFPDSLTGGPYQGQVGSVMLLTRAASLPTVTAAALQAHNPHICERVHIYGGLLAVSSAVRTQIMSIVTPCPSIVAVDAVLVMPAAALGLVKEADVDFFAAEGEVITYTYTLTNSGDFDLDAPFTVVDSEIGTITVGAMDLAVGADVSVEATYTVTADDVVAGSVVNTATAQGFFEAEPVLSAETELTVYRPALSLAKVASTEDTVTVGDEIIYTYTLTNSGGGVLDGPFNVVDSQIGTIPVDPVMWTELAPDASVEVTASYMVTIADVLAGTATNDAYAVGWFAGVEFHSAPVTVAIPAAAAVDAVLFEAFGIDHHHLTISARDVLETTPTVAPLDETDFCLRLLNTGGVAVDVDIMFGLDATMLDSQWWYYDGTEWVDAAAGGILNLTLDPDVAEEICFYVFFENDPGNYTPFDVEIEVYEAGTVNLLASTYLEVNLSAPAGP